MKNSNPSYFKLFGFNFPIPQRSYLNLLVKVYVGMLLLLFASILLFDYSMTNADLPGGLIAGALLAYLLDIL